jgi:hypothetical protein
MILSKDLLALGHKVESLEEAGEFCPAIFSIAPHPLRTDRYSFLPSNVIVSEMQKLGWEITSVSQSGTGVFNRHIVRMVHRNLVNFGSADQILPQIVIDNSHDGLTQAQIHMGLYRVISRTGLVISIPEHDYSFKFRHVGKNGSDLTELMELVTEKYKELVSHVREMMKVELTDEEIREFAIKAIAAREPWRFKNAQGEILTSKVEKLNNIDEILTPKREENVGTDLWRVFNTIQEILTNGGYERLSDKERKSRTRAITIPSRNVDFNKDLWELAESYLSVPELV